MDNVLTRRPTLSIRAVLEALPKALRREPVAKILLVEARLATTGRIAFQRPVARRVGCERLVDEDELVTLVDEPKLEFGVCYDESARCCVLRRSCVQFQSDVGNSVVEFWADERRRCFSEYCGLRVVSCGGWGGTSPCSGEMFSSCAPCSAFVEGVKSGMEVDDTKHQ